MMIRDFGEVVTTLPDGFHEITACPPGHSESIHFFHVKSWKIIAAFPTLRNRESSRPAFYNAALISVQEMAIFVFPSFKLVPKLVETSPHDQDNAKLHGGESYQRKHREITLNRTDQSSIVLINIWRAGEFMGAIFDEYLKRKCAVMHIGIRREGEYAHPVIYANKVGNLGSDTRIVIGDPMLATGGSVCEAIKAALHNGARAENITTVHLVAAPDGVKKINDLFPNVKIIVAAMDEKLDKKYYICGTGLFPYYGGGGLGDFGDRVNGTPHE